MNRIVYVTKLFFLLPAFLLPACTETSNDFGSPVVPGTPGTETPGESGEGHEYPTPTEEAAFAFPGAQGGGMKTTGGRGGKVYMVTSLEDTNTPGTLRHALNQSGARIIVFNLSGTIQLKSALSIRNGDVTIAGQTAPGDGICLAGYPVDVNASNVIIRYMRFRMGDKEGEKVGADGADALGGRKQQNVMIDHCSISWCTDECASFYDNKDFTMQWCIISESLRLSGHSKGPHGYGAIWGGVNASYHHNLLAHHDSRTPRFGAGAKYISTERTDARNNVIYNWSGNGCYGGEGMSINIVNNYYKPGPATDSKIATRVMGIDINTDANNSDFKPSYMKTGKYYIAGNYFPNSASVTADNWTGIKNNTGADVALLKAAEPITVDQLTTIHTAEEAYTKVLAYAGCSKSRDEVDARIVDETATGKAAYKGLSEHNGEGGDWKSANYPKWGIIDSQDDLRPAQAGADWSAWPTLNSTELPADTDKDGMPDEWELANGLDPETDDANGRHLSTAYDNIEVYINSLVQEITEKQY